MSTTSVCFVDPATLRVRASNTPGARLIVHDDQADVHFQIPATEMLVLADRIRAEASRLLLDGVR